MKPADNQTRPRLTQWSWAFFEFARNPYYNLVVIYIFGPYFTLQVIGDPVRGQSLWGYINGIAGLAVALTAPFIGAIADNVGKRKPWVLGAVLVMSPTMFFLWFAEPGATELAIYATAAVITLAGICYAISQVCHNAMLVSVAPNNIGSISGLGLALGNAGALILLMFALYALALPASDLVSWDWIPDAPWFGLNADEYEHSRIIGPILSVWLLVFTLPLLLWVRETAPRVRTMDAVRAGIKDLRNTLTQAMQHKNIMLYLISRMLFNDGKLAIMTFGNIYAASLFGWGLVHIIILGIVLSLVAVVGGVMGGWMDERFGSKPSLLFALSLIAVCLVFTLTMGPDMILFIHIPWLAQQVNSLPLFNTPAEVIYVGISFLYALFITSAYVSSRTMLVRIAPPEAMAKFFGLYALSGEVTAFAAPLAIGILTAWTQSQRGGLFIVLAFILGGGALLLKVKEERV